MSNSHPTTMRSYLDPWRDLQIGLATAASLQTSIRHADTKAIALLAIEGGTVTAAVDRVAPAIAGDAPIMVLLAAAALATLFAIGLASATWQLVMALRPRIDGTRSANRFAFPDLVRANSSPSAASTRRHRNEAWELVMVLALIALQKHERVHQSIPWLLLAMASASGLVLISIWM